MITDALKPREQWNADDWFDFLDGWHEASDLGFKTKHNPDRVVVFHSTAGHGKHTGAALMASGRASRERHG